MSTGLKTDSFLTGIGKVFNEKLPNSWAEVHTIADDAALTQVFMTSLKWAPYSWFSNHFGVNDLGHALSSRVAFIESWCMALASMVHNLVFSLVYTGLTLITAGSSTYLSERCIAHWSHVSYAGMALVIAAASVVTPYYGNYVCAGIAYYLFQSVKENYEKDSNRYGQGLLAQIREVIRKNWSEINQLVRSSVDETRFSNVFSNPMELAKKRILGELHKNTATDAEKNYIDALEKDGKTVNAKKVEDIIEILWDAKSEFVNLNYNSVNNAKKTPETANV